VLHGPGREEAWSLHDGVHRSLKPGSFPMNRMVYLGMAVAVELDDWLLEGNHLVSIPEASD
jgi:hypothetical protein